MIFHHNEHPLFVLKPIFIAVIEYFQQYSALIQPKITEKLFFLYQSKRLF